MTSASITSKDADLISCHSCHLLCRPAAPQGHRPGQCPRCSATLHLRKPRSIKRTWALLSAAAICYIPANVLPVTKATSLGDVQIDTIMSGVIYFINTGMWPIALVIFVASILVPLLKIVILSGLLVSVQRRSIMAFEGSHPFLPPDRDYRALVHGRCLCHYDFSRPGQNGGRRFV